MSHKKLSTHYLSLLFILTANLTTCSPKNNHIPCDQWHMQITNGLSIDRQWQEIYISRATAQKDPNGRNANDIYQLSYKDGSFTAPAITSFSLPSYIDYHPVLSPDNQRLFFISWRPVPGSDKPLDYGNIWYVDRQGDDWGAPVYMNAINHDGHDSYPTVTRDGTLYFNSDRKGGQGGMDIYKSTLRDGRYMEPKPVKALNSRDAENDLFIEPDERFIIFNRYYEASGEMDMLISFHENGDWSAPEKLDLINRAGIYELTPTISPDGLLFFYEVEGEVQCIPMAELMESIGRSL